MMSGEACSSREAVRMIMYQFVALAFYEPAESLFEVVEKNAAAQALLEAGVQILGPKGEELTRAALNAMGEPSKSREAELLDLEVEFNRLFVGPMPPVCPPYESVYDQNRSREDLGTMMGPSSEVMAQALRSEGLELTLDYAELPDHAAIELEFMFYLLSRANEHGQDSEIHRQKADAFLRDHLSRWMPQFGAKVSQASRHPFYRNIGDLLAAVISADMAYVNSKTD